MPEARRPLVERPRGDGGRVLDVDQALDIVVSAFAPTNAETVPLHEAGGRVLACEVVACDNVPPFRNSAMDGYAVRATDSARATRNDPVEFPVVAEIAAGQRDVPSLTSGAAMRIMTGAPMPVGADAVVPFEVTDEEERRDRERRATIRVFRAAAAQDHVRQIGEDIAQDDLVARRGTEVSPAMAGLLASVGVGSVTVHRRPVVGILSTGNEIMAAESALLPGTIRDSNSPVLAAFARQWGADVRLLGIARDTLSELSTALERAREVDLLVTSGGVSRGDYDFVKDVLQASGEVAIWQVKMKPGKPLAFGSIHGTLLLGLPGNPVAAAVSLFLFGRPAIRKMLGYDDLAPRTIEVEAADPHDNRGRRRHFVRVTLAGRDHAPPLATIAGDQGAGILSSLAAADALLVVPETIERVEAGMRLRAIPLDQ